jgi:hypothetical protein
MLPMFNQDKQENFSKVWRKKNKKEKKNVNWLYTPKIKKINGILIVIAPRT